MYAKLLLTFVFTCGLLGMSWAQTPKPPNIVFILTDDLGWSDVCYNGSQYYETPSIDRLASQGMVFTSAYANAPVCGPSRAALLSGQYAPRTGFYTNGSPERGEASWRAAIPPPTRSTLDSTIITLAEALKPAGYTSAYVGKWHLGNPPKLGPNEQGFDINIGGYSSGKPRSYFSPYQNPYLKDGPQGEYLTDRLTAEGINFIKNNQDQPFLLFLSYHSPHTPIQAKDSLVWPFIPKPSYRGHFDPIYAAMIKSVDEGVGRIIETLHEFSLDENTIVVFFSDNGGLHAVTSNTPLRAYKGTLYEGGIRVPMVVRWTGTVAAGTYCHEPVIGVDFYPTFLEVTGREPPKDYLLDGKSLVPLLKQQGTMEQESLYWYFPAYLQGGYGLNQAWRTTPVAAIRSGNFKLLEFLEDGRLELYDLTQDLGEQNNLARMLPDKTQALRHQLHRWKSSLGIEHSLKKNPTYDPSTLPVNEKMGQRKEIYTY